MRQFFIRCLIVLSVCIVWSPAFAESDRDVDGVVLPHNTTPASAALSAFAGTWIGTWGGTWKHILVVEAISDAKTGKAKVIYALGDNPRMRFKRSWTRYDAQISGDTMTVMGRGFKVTYRLSKSGRLRGVFGTGNGFSVMRRVELASLIKPAATVAWTVGAQVFLDTPLTDAGAVVRLEAMIYKPEGPGPFPLAVVNHGSTGTGDDPAVMARTWTNAWFADLLNARGWIVAFPQRRGRGKSGGSYDEGLSADRSKGYSCRTGRSLAGADRALVDVRAAVDALRKRSDVETSPVLMAGNSRGGALSIAYAGAYPADTAGVVNFVGGWMGTQCRNAAQINHAIFQRGSPFKRPTLWIYGKDDVYYPIAHSRKNFTAFEASGGTGDFVTVTVAGRNNGHWAMSIPPLWSKTLNDYLDRLSDKR